MKAKGRPVRIQLLDDLDAANFLAAIATRLLEQKSKGRCAIVVSNLQVAAATYEKLLENDLKTNQISLSRTRTEKPDPSISVAVCTLRDSKLLFGQSFDIKAFGFAPPLFHQDRSRTVHNPEKIAAGLHVEVGPSFHSLDVDYSYTWEQAHADNRVAAMQALVMPLRLQGTGSFETAEVWEALANVIQQHSEWAPMIIFFNRKKQEIDSCTTLLQTMGISAAHLPSVRFPTKLAHGDLLKSYSKKLADGDLQVLCTCQTMFDTFLPDSIRSIVWASKHQDSARSLPRSLFKALCRRRESSLTLIHIIYDTDRFSLRKDLLLRTRLAAMSFAFYLGWPQFGEMPDSTMAQRHVQPDHLASLDEIAARFDKSKGATLELLKTHGKIVRMTEQNARDAMYSDNIKLLCGWLQSEQRIPRQRFGTVEGDHWKTWSIARDMLEKGKMSAETHRLLSKVSSVDVIPTMQKQMSRLARYRRYRSDYRLARRKAGF